MLRIGWFSTGRGAGSQGLLRFVGERLGDIDARIEFVFSNRAPGEAEGSDAFFRLTGELGLPLVTHSSARFRQGRDVIRRSQDDWRERQGRGGWRDVYDREVLELLGGYGVDVCVLAGYMLVVGSGLCRAWPMLNLHPALPDGPVGSWQEVVWRLIGERARVTGVMTHLVTEDVDRGPVVSYVTLPLDTPELEGHWRDLEGRDVGEIRAREGEDYGLFRLIRAAQYRREPYLLLETLRAVGAGEISLAGGRVTVVDGGGGDAAGYGGVCMDRRVDRAMAESGLSG